MFALAADSAYPISWTIVKPYPHANRPTQSHKDINFEQARLRNEATEKIFGQVKSRFRILHNGLRTSVKKSQLIIASCLVLHNMAQIFGDTRFSEEDLNDGVDGVDDLEEEPDQENNPSDAARRKGGEEYCEYLRKFFE